MKLSDLNNQYVLFKGVFNDGETVLVKINDQVFSFTEDPDDGYRSYMITNGSVTPPDYANFNFELNPVKLFVRYGNNGSFEGLELYLTEQSDCVAQFGTDNIDDYYPVAMNFVDVVKINEYFFIK